MDALGKNESRATVLLTSAENVQNLRKKLTDLGIFDGSRRVDKQEDGSFAIPCKESGFGSLFHNLDNIEEHLPPHLLSKSSMISVNELLMEVGNNQFSLDGMKFTIGQRKLPLSKKECVKSDYEKLLDGLKILLHERGYKQSDILKDCPRHWERHGDLVLLPDGAFTSELWDILRDDLFVTLSDVLRAQRIARKSVISQDGFRTPQVQILLGEDGWVKHVDNGIRYSYDITRCMFSAGNITEKLRLAKLDCHGETVVDLYAGIGYFTLPYLVHAKAAMVHACEWNPNAVAALKHNLELNGVMDRCVIHEGDNREVCPKNIADRVNLGLIPSSVEGWPIACSALKSDTGGVLHIHSNVTIDPMRSGELTNTGRNHGANLEENKVESNSRADGGSGTADGRPTRKEKVMRSQTSFESWAETVSLIIGRMLAFLHNVEWSVRILHIERVKSYAPHVYHVVLDLDCRPVTDAYS